MVIYKMIKSVQSSSVQSAVNSIEGKGSKTSSWKEAWGFSKGQNYRESEGLNMNKGLKKNVVGSAHKSPKRVIKGMSAGR